MIDPDHLVGVAEIADAAGVTRGLVSQWSSRDLDFPEPVAHVALGPLWLWPAVAAWLEATNRDTRPDGGSVRRPYGPYDRHHEQLEQVDGLVSNGLDLGDACKVAAGQHRAGQAAVRLAHQLRHLYPGWKARERMTR